MNYTDKKKTLRLDLTLSQEPSKLQAIVNTTWLDHCHLRRQSRAGSFSHTGEWNRTGYPKFCVVRTVFFSLALIDICCWFFVFFSLQGRNSLWRIVADNA